MIRVLTITTPDLSELAAALDPVALHDALGRDLSARLKAHFNTRAPNRKGWPSSGFWQKIAGRTAFESADARGATVVVADARLRLRYFGGIVRPRTARALAIPLRPEASAAGSPREFTDLFVIRSRATGRAFLARREGAALRLYFALVKQAVHRPDPTAIPDAPTLAGELAATAADFVRARLPR